MYDPSSVDSCPDHGLAIDHCFDSAIDLAAEDGVYTVDHIDAYPAGGSNLSTGDVGSRHFPLVGHYSEGHPPCL